MRKSAAREGVNRCGLTQGASVPLGGINRALMRGFPARIAGRISVVVIDELVAAGRRRALCRLSALGGSTSGFVRVAGMRP